MLRLSDECFLETKLLEELCHSFISFHFISTSNLIDDLD